jgi:hypothetical protein
MSDSERPDETDLTKKIVAAFTTMGRAVAEVAEAFRPAVETVARFSRDPRVQSAFAADHKPGHGKCRCLCALEHRDDLGICEGESVGMVQISGMDVAMCAPCQAARAAAKLSSQS